MPAFQFETNLPVILLVIVIALVSLYFYLELKKIKLVNEELEKKNEIIVKEIDNIHLRLHKFFNNMPKMNNIPKEPQMSSIPKETSNNNKSNIKVEENINETSNIENKTEISENEFNNLKKKPSNNIFGEIEELISENSMTQEKSINEDIELPELVPVQYESEKITEEKDNLEEDDEVDDINSDDEELSDDIDEDKLDKYMKMSVKELKDKCIEMNLKHSGNKTTLARRIVENLE